LKNTILTTTKQLEMTNFGDKRNTAGFDVNKQNINKKGRHKKIYTILKEKGYSADDIKTAFGEVAFYTEKEIEQLHDDIEKPIIVRIVAKMYFTALEDGDWSKIKEIIEHSIGRATQTVDAKINQIPQIIFQDISGKEIEDGS